MRYLLIFHVQIFVIFAACSDDLSDFSQSRAEKAIVATPPQWYEVLKWSPGVLETGVREGLWILQEEEGETILVPTEDGKRSPLFELPVRRSMGDDWKINLHKIYDNGNNTPYFTGVAFSINELRITKIWYSKPNIIVDFECDWKPEDRLWKYFEPPAPDCWGSALLRRYDREYQLVSRWFHVKGFEIPSGELKWKLIQ